MKEINVVGAAIIQDNKVLAAQRSATMSTPLKWEFFGGKVEKDETHQQALIREAKEELGIKIKVGDYIATGSSETEDRRILLHVYKAEILEGTPTAKEHAQLKWVEISNIKELDWAEADIPACEELLKKTPQS